MAKLVAKKKVVIPKAETPTLKKEEPKLYPGVYMNYSRNTAIALQIKNGVVGFVTMRSGKIETVRRSVEDFMREFYLCLPSYPIGRAIRLYHSSTLDRSEHAAQVMRRVLAQ